MQVTVLAVIYLIFLFFINISSHKTNKKIKRSYDFALSIKDRQSRYLLQSYEESHKINKELLIQSKRISDLNGKLIGELNKNKQGKNNL